MSATQQSPDPSRPRRLLVLDDEPSICEFVRRVAETAGFEVKTSVSHEEFSRLYDSFAPTGILFDLVMPQVDGIAVMQRLAERDCRTPLVIMSGYHPELLKSGQRLGDHYDLDVRGTLRKPFGMAELLAAMRWFDEPDAPPQNGAGAAHSGGKS